MRLFFYYAIHTFINTLKKLLKTWVAIFLVIMVGSALIGVIIGRLVPMVINSVKSESTSEVIEEIVEEEEEEETEDEVEEPSRFSIFLESNGFNKYNVVDIIVTACFFLIVTLCLAAVNKGGQIFKPADVPILFASPMKPQSVLMFRMMNSLGANIFVSLYMLFQIPNFVTNLHFSVWGAFSILLAYTLVLIFATLLQVGFYTIACRTEKGKINIAGFILGFYAILAAGFIIYTLITKESLSAAAFHFFGSKNTFWIPFWGWMRGMIYFALTGETVKSIIYLALFIVGCILVIVLIWNIKADFYENAMFAAEKVAAAIENQQNAASGHMVTREKERSSKLERDGFAYGSGASVFFYKAVYNRFRFAKLKIFTIKFMIYLLVACVAGYFLRSLDAKMNLFFVPAAIFMAIAYFGSIGNPLQEDTSREFFILIPEEPIKKVWASLLGVLAVNAIDLIIPMIVAAVFLGTNPFTVFAWLVFILSVVCFGSTVGTFVNLSVPGDHSQTIKMMIQLMIVYFGATPSAVFAIMGFVLNMVTPMLLIGSAFNIGLGILFAFLSTKFLGNR